MLLAYRVHRQFANQRFRRSIRRALSAARHSRPRHFAGLWSQCARFLRSDGHRDVKTCSHITPPATVLSSGRQSERRRPAPSGQASPRCTRAKSHVAQVLPPRIRSGPDGDNMHLPQRGAIGPSATRLYRAVIGATRPRAGTCCIRLLPADEHLHNCYDRVTRPQASILAGWSGRKVLAKGSLQLTTAGTCPKSVHLALHRITTALPAITTPGSIIRADATAASP